MALGTLLGNTTPIVDTDGAGGHWVGVTFGGAGTFAGGTVSTRATRSTTPTVTSVAATVGNVTLLGANVNRFGAAFYVEGGQPLFLKLGSSAGTVDYTVQVTPGAYYELPFNYSGTVAGIWQTAGGTVRITEVT
jgi:hypothetical protein